MKTILKAFVIISIFIFTGKLSAQADAAVPMLYLNPSPKLNGLGMTGTSLPNEDPAGFYYNPAMLGYISQNNTISFQMYPSKVNWLGFNFLSYENKSFNIGYNLKNLLGGLNLSAGFGYIHSKMDWGKFIFTGPDSPTPLYSPPYSVDTFDQFDAYGFGVGIDYFVQFNVGISYKKIISQIPRDNYDSPEAIDANISTLDYGMLLTIPVTRLVSPVIQFPILENILASPYLNLSLGYAQLNVGNELYYIDRSQTEPLPRTARLGYTISSGINIKLNSSTIKAIGYEFTVDADDDLIETDPYTYTHSYQGFLGDIKIGRNLIGLKSDNNVVVHKGHNVNLFETISFQIGRFDGRGYYNDKSSGIGIQTKGIFTLLKTFTNNNVLNFIADHLDIQYYSTTLFVDSGLDSNFKGINVIWYGMMF
jgi:hypothetical protein